LVTNVVNGSVGLTSGVALLNKSFGTTVIGQLTRITPINKVLILNSPIIVGNGNANVPSKHPPSSNALESKKWFDDFLLSVTNALILAGSVKSL
jgi:hypothetical protein